MGKSIKVGLILCVYTLLSNPVILAETSPITVKPDKRIELFWTAFILSPTGSELQKTFIYPYRHHALNHFQNLKGHKAVEIAEKLIQSEWFFLSDIVTIPLYHSEPPELKQLYDYPSDFKNRINSHGSVGDDLESFLNAVRKFYKDSSFENYWQKNLAEYKKVVCSIESLVSGIDIKILEEYYGSPVRMKFIIVPSLMTPAGFNFGPSVESENTVYFIISPSPKSSDTADFTISEEKLEAQAFHEFGHGYVNYLTEEYKNGVNDRDSLFKYLNYDSLMTKYHYGKWDICLNEHLIEVVKARIKAMRGDEVGAREYVEKLESAGFGLSGVLYDKLTQYEVNRDKYPTLRDFYPTLLTILDSLLITQKQTPVFAFSCSRVKEGHPQVTFVSYLSEAQKAGLKVDDIILSLDGSKIKNINEIEEKRKQKPIGSIVNVQILREEKENIISFAVEAQTYYEFKKISQ